MRQFFEDLIVAALIGISAVIIVSLVIFMLAFLLGVTVMIWKVILFT